MSNFEGQCYLDILLAFSDWTLLQSITQLNQPNSQLFRSVIYYSECSLWDQVCCLWLNYPPVTEPLPALDNVNDNGMSTVFTMTKGGNASANAVPCFLHVTSPTNNRFYVHLMLCHHMPI